MSDSNNFEPQSAPQHPAAPHVPEGWVAVPPPHPYAQVAPGGERPRPGGGLAIVALAIGLIALLTTAVSAFYFTMFALPTILGALLGLIAVAVGIAAIVKRHRPQAASVVGLIAGALALLVAVGIGGLALGAVLMPDGPNQGSGTSEPEQEMTPETDLENGTVPDAEEPLLVWPNNMSSGGILFDDSLEPVRSGPIEAGKAPGPHEVDRENGPVDIQLYVDYRCPHCVNFETANVDLLERVVSSGEATLEIRPVAFVSPFSTPLLGALVCVVDAQPEATWVAHRTMLSPDTQHISDSRDLVRAIDEQVPGGLSAEARSCIETDQFVPFASALSGWILSNPVPNAVDSGLRIQGTPFAVVNGVPYPGEPSNGAAFEAFLAGFGVNTQ